MKLYFLYLNRLYKIKRRTCQVASLNDQGFTLLELLVTALIGGLVVSGLLFLTNELLTTDQRESNRTETQRELQSALDFITSELKESVYVYENASCVIGDEGAKCKGTDSIINIDNLDVLKTLPGTNPTTPVLAFWKQVPLTSQHADECAGNSAAETIPCLSGHSYSLVVYGYSENANDGGPWEGEAGIVRHEMGLTPNSLGGEDPVYGKYVAPNAVSVNFTDWPIENSAALGEPQILVDFVDNFQDDDQNGNNGYFADQRKCPGGYFASPNTKGDSIDVDETVGGFYACVSDRGGSSTGSVSTSSTSSSVASFGNQDVILYLRGNASGRSGLMTEESFLPVLESRVVVRGSLNRL